MRAEGLTAIFPLLTNLAETYTWKTKEMENVTGATAEAHKEMAEGINKIGYEYEQAKQRIIVASQKLGDALGEKGAFASISKRIEDLTDAIREASPETIDFFTNLGIALAALSVGSLILSKIVLAVSTLAPYITQIAAAIIPIMDFIQWMKGEGPSMFQDILGEFPGPFGKGGGKPGEPPSIFSKEGFEAAKPYINDFIKGLNTLATLGLNWVGLPEPVPYIKPSSTTQPVVVNAENHISVTLPDGASEDKVIQATQKSVSDSLDTLARDIQRNFPKTE